MFMICGERMLVLLGLFVMVTVTFAGTGGEQSHEGIVGFTAWVQDTQEYNIGDQIIFEGCNLNEGGWYQPSVGRFFCSQDAVYFITLNLRRNGNEANHVKVFIDETQEVLDVYDYRGENDWNIASNSALVECKQAQSISVIGAWNGGVVYGETGMQHSTFTVFMLSTGTSANKHNDTVFGFTAYLTGNAVHYETNEVIKFAGEIYNSGAYSPQTGYFTCPVTGVYYINTNIQRYHDYDLHVGVSLDSIIVLHSEDRVVDDNYYNTISNSRFVKCSQAQTLSVKGLSDGYIHGTEAANRFTTFSVMYIGKSADLYINADTDMEHISFQGFTAFKLSDQTYIAGDNITFESVLVNEGGHFNGEAFECPVTAVYFVSVNLRKVGSEPIYLDVVQGPITMFRSEESYTDNQSNTVSNSGLFRCLQGELVKVQAFNSGSVYGDPVNTYTTFSVMLISQIE